MTDQLSTYLETPPEFQTEMKERNYFRELELDDIHTVKSEGVVKFL